jgi:hypothetical protein
MKFLEAAPDAHSVLRAYASRLEPRMGGGAEAMKPRADAIGALVKSANADFAKAAIAVISDVNNMIDSIRQREMHRDEEREQTFE